VELNKREIEKLKPREGAYYVTDSETKGLQLRIAPDGSKTWSLRYRINGQQKRFTIGDFPLVPLNDEHPLDANGKRIKGAEVRKGARTLAKDALANGNDPAAAKRQAREAAERERHEAITFQDLADEYIAKHAKKTKRSWKEDQRMLNADVLPFWKKRLVRDITRRDIRERVEAIAERAPIAANRVVALLSKMFTFALDREIITTSPAVKITRPGTEQKRDRVLTHDEIRTFWTETEALEAPMRAFFRLRLLTAQRGVEVGTMKWPDLDLENGWWTIPATVAKNKLSHRVPLSQAVIDMLTALPRHKHTKYVLDGARGKRQQAEAAATFTIKDFRGHDLRRTAASLMAGSGTSRLVISKILNHVETGVTAVYDRHSYDAEKRIALDNWARTLNDILKKKDGKKNVVMFAARG
jgi:integrase